MIALYFISLLFQEIVIDMVGMSLKYILKNNQPNSGLVNVKGKRNGNLRRIFREHNNCLFIIYI